MSGFAIPGYVPLAAVREASPGLRFGLFFKQPALPADGPGSTAGGRQASWKLQGLKDACALTENDKARCAALLERQRELATALALQGTAHRIVAKSTSPFTTGLGNEHPVENGFAFLNPYGLPYLAGSGVKGIVRQAAVELDWPLRHREALLGSIRETDDSGQRGVLRFWDVFPQLAGGALTVEIMTPHQTHYLQGRDSPHDSGSPNPIPFLAVPAGSTFAFHVECDPMALGRTAPELVVDKAWARLLDQAFEHAFEWLGFGAKKTVGYGAMRRDASAEARERQALQERQQATERERENASLSPQRRVIREFELGVQDRLAQRKGRKAPISGADYAEFKRLAEAAKGADWSAEDRRHAVDVLERQCAAALEIAVKDLRKKLNLAALLAS